MLAVPGAIQLSDAKSARVLGSEITQAGIAVYDALQHEPELQDARQRYSHMCSSSLHHNILHGDMVTVCMTKQGQKAGGCTR